MEYILMLISALIMQNIVVVALTGIEVFVLMESKKSKVFMLTLYATGLTLLTFIISYPLQALILKPLEIEILQPLVYILTLFFVALIIKKIFVEKNQKISDFLNHYLFYILLNSAFLGVSITYLELDLAFIESVIYIIGTSIGYGLMLYTFLMIKSRMGAYKIPKVMEGLPITFIILGIIAMSLLGLAGII